MVLKRVILFARGRALTHARRQMRIAEELGKRSSNSRRTARPSSSTSPSTASCSSATRLTASVSLPAGTGECSRATHFRRLAPSKRREVTNREAPPPLSCHPSHPTGARTRRCPGSAPGTRDTAAPLPAADRREPPGGAPCRGAEFVETIEHDLFLDGSGLAAAACCEHARALNGSLSIGREKVATRAHGGGAGGARPPRRAARTTRRPRGLGGVLAHLRRAHPSCCSDRERHTRCVGVEGSARRAVIEDVLNGRSRGRDESRGALSCWKDTVRS